MPTRRSLLERGAAVSGLAAVGVTAGPTSGVAGAQSLDDPTGGQLNDFESPYPGENRLGEYSDHVAFEAADLTDGVLRVEYEDAGFLTTRVDEDLTGYNSLALTVRGDDGGEEDDVGLKVGNVRAPLSELTNDSIGTEFGEVAVDLEAAGVDLEALREVRLDFWRGGSGAIELEEIAVLGDVPDPTPSGPIEPDTTLDDFHDPESYEFSEYEHLPDVWTQYMPGELDGGGYEDYDRTTTPDSEKAEQFDVDLEAIQQKVDDRTLTFEEMGTQAIDWVDQFEAEGFPRHASEKLLPRLSLLPDETEELAYHRGDPQEIWDVVGGPQEATNDPEQLIQDPWPPDAPHYKSEGVDIRERSHDQPRLESDESHEWYDPDVEWTTYAELPDDYYYDEDHPIHSVADGVNPVTGEEFGGDGFTANAPMDVRVRLFVNTDGYWFQILEFENTSQVPYHLNSTVVTWIGPSGANGSLIDGHYTNEQRPTSGYGHPQRDVIEVVHDEEAGLSAYAVRICFHDRPYNMRTAYPNQRWALEIGTQPPDASRWETEAERQELLDTIVETCHVEVETDMDANMEWLDTLRLRNRLNN